MKTNPAIKFLKDFINEGKFLACAEAIHTSWMELKISQGWVYGPKRNAKKKTNPLLKPFNELSEEHQSLSKVPPYAVADFFYNIDQIKSLPKPYKTLKELDQTFSALLAGEMPDLLQELSEAVHSHFMIGQFAQGESTKTREDMIIYEDLDETTQSWDTRVALEVIKYLREEIKK